MALSSSKVVDGGRETSCEGRMSDLGAGVTLKLLGDREFTEGQLTTQAEAVRSRSGIRGGHGIVKGS